jgi:uncharacterized protein (DUF1501 family)
LKHTQLDLSVNAHRRDGLKALLGAAALTFSLPARLSFAASSGDKANSEQRLVVVLLRGALDGLAAVPATGDPAWADLRGHSEAILRSQAQTTAAAIGINSPNSQSSSALLPLDSTFGFHPGLKALHQWYSQKELLVIHAVASPYRERSHFDAQQLLESGGDLPFSQSTGWLGRALQSSGLFNAACP